MDHQVEQALGNQVLEALDHKTTQRIRTGMVMPHWWRKRLTTVFLVMPATNEEVVRKRTPIAPQNYFQPRVTLFNLHESFFGES